MRLALRSLARTPGFTAVAVLTLALGIGASTALFSVINAVLLQPLPFPSADRLSIVWETNPQQGVKREGPSGPDFSDWREQSRLHEDLAAFELGSGTVTGLGEPRQIPAMRVTSNLLSLLHARPAHGRLFLPADGRGGRQALLIVSHDFWQRALGGDPAVIGRKVMVDQISYQIIGVLDRDFRFPFPSDLFVPWPDDELRFNRARLDHDLGVIGRLKSGVTFVQAEGELNAVQARLRAAHPELTGWDVTVMPLQAIATEYVRPALVALSAAVAVLLLIACANVANLLLTRAVGRSHEVAVRAALGASGWRLLRQYLVESLALGLLAGVLGVVFAAWGVSFLAALVPAAVPVPDAAAEVALPAFAIDGRVLGFGLGLSLLTSVLFGIVPAIHALKIDLLPNLKQSSRTTKGGGRRTRAALLVAEVALALVLLAGAGLMLRSFGELQRADLGFRPDHLLTLEMELPTDTRYRSPTEQSAFFARVLAQVEALPGVTRAAVTSVLPLHPQDQRVNFLVEDAPPLPPDERLRTDLRRVSSGYFQTMGIPLKQGRLLEHRDGPPPASPLVAVIDEAFARRFFGEQNPLGRYLLLGRSRVEIVGVVGNVKHIGADHEGEPTLYLSFQQRPADRMNLVLRTAVEPGALVAAAKQAIWTVDRDQPIYRIESMDLVVAGSMSAQHITLSLLQIFAGVALGLAAVGIYGVMAYSVSQRTQEIGLRMALGARSVDVIAHVLRRGMTLVGIGMAIGLSLVLALGRVLQSLLYRTSPHDLLTLVAIAATLALVALLACWLPARRATKVDPMVALHAE